MKIGKPKKTVDREALEKLIDEAYDRCPGSEFVESVETFLNENGFLSAKQIEALKKVRPRQSYSGFDGGNGTDSLFDSYDEHDDIGHDPDDFF